MSEDNYNMDDAEFRELMAALVDQTIDEADFYRFSKELVDNQDRRAAYVEYSALHSDLKSTIDSAVPVLDPCVHADFERLFGAVGEGERELVTPASLQHSTVSSARSSSALNWVAIAVLGTILFVSGMWVYQSVSEVAGRMREMEESPGIQSRRLELRERDNALEIGRETVAVVTSAVGVRWTEGAAEFKEGSSLSPGLLQFDSGVVRVEFFSGVTMFLEGPAKFDIVDSMNGFVHQGSLRVSVPEHAKGFTIGSKTVDVEDLGTEFGMNIGSDGRAEVHVLDGEVRVREAEISRATNSSDKSNVVGKGSSQLLLKGEGIRVSESGLMNRIATNEKQFVGPKQFVARVKALEMKKLQLWNLSMDALRKDPSILALYTFPESGASTLWDRTLLDSSDQANDGSIVGCKWSDGRFSGKRALAYSSPGDRVPRRYPRHFFRSHPLVLG